MPHTGGVQNRARMTKAYFLSGASYWRYDVDADTTDSGYPKPIANGWTGIDQTDFTDGIDAALDLGKGVAYLFRGDRYLRLDQSGPAVDGDPASIADHWQGLLDAGFDADLDAALNLGNGYAWLFKGDQCLRWDIEHDQVGGAPMAIADEWKGLAELGFDSDLDAAVDLGKGSAYFFKGTQYVRYDLGANHAATGYPLDIVGQWTGLDAAVPVDAVWVRLASPSAPPTPTGHLEPGDALWYWNGQVSRTPSIPNQAWFGTKDKTTDYGGHGPEIYNFVIHADGEIRRGRPQMRGYEGSTAWLNNNPGNIQSTGGNLGEYPGKVNWHNFGIYPTEAAGMEGIIKLLTGPNYRDLSILATFEKYAPASDGNDPGSYAAKVAASAGVSADTKLKDLTVDQLHLVQAQIRQIEGWVPGVVLSVDSPELPAEVRALL